ncbi:MAG: hypothetical protein ACK50P_06055 [Planctomycetaceae bacterium]
MGKRYWITPQKMRRVVLLSLALLVGVACERPLAAGNREGPAADWARLISSPQRRRHHSSASTLGNLTDGKLCDLFAHRQPSEFALGGDEEPAQPGACGWDDIGWSATSDTLTKNDEAEFVFRGNDAPLEGDASISGGAIEASEHLAQAASPWQPLTVEAEVVESPSPAHPAAEFGTPGSSHWLLVLMPAYVITSHEMMYVVDVEYDYFLLKNLSLNLHLQGFYFDQPGTKAWAIGPAMTLRYSFFVQTRSRFFAAGGVGMMASDEPVPEIVGSRLNFTPRAAVGWVYSFTPRVSVVTGLRVSHLDALEDVTFKDTVLQCFVGLTLVLR